MSTHRLREVDLAGCPPRADRREDAAAGRMQLLVARPAGAEVELGHAVAQEAGVRVAVDEPRNCAAATAVELDDVGGKRREVTHAADRGDAPVRAENVRALEHVDGCQLMPSE